MDIILSSNTSFVWGGLALVVSLLAYVSVINSKSSRIAEQRKNIREAYKKTEFGNSTKTVNEAAKLNKRHKSSSSLEGLQISKLFIYPIKSIRGCEVSSAMLTRNGFYLDRCFMLLKDNGGSPRDLKNMHVPTFTAMALFHTAIRDNKIIVSYHAPGSSSPPPEEENLEILLEPESLSGLEKVEVNMHKSPTTGYDMGEKYNAWFSKRFGFKVILAYWGGNPRLPLGNLPGKPATDTPKTPNVILRLLSSVPVLGSFLQPDNDIIAFNDCAPFLVISETSVDDVSGRLPGDLEMDLTKFRANIVVKGSQKAYSEDYWSELTFSSSPATPAPNPKILLTANCARCASLNVDYKTGKPGIGPEGQVLKALQSDRRVDAGTKYSPVFGRYGFAARDSEGTVLRVGDVVEVTGKNEERTTFFWPGLST